MESHLKNHGMDLRVYEKRFRHELDVIFEAFNEIEIEYGDDEDDDDDFSSVFEGNIYISYLFFYYLCICRS